MIFLLCILLYRHFHHILATRETKLYCDNGILPQWQGLMQYHEEIVQYFNRRGVSAIFLFRRNLLRRMISLLANSYDKEAKLLNGTHKSHVHSSYEVSLSL